MSELYILAENCMNKMNVIRYYLLPNFRVLKLCIKKCMERFQIQIIKNILLNDVDVTALTCRINKNNNTYRLSGLISHPAGRQNVERAVTQYRIRYTWNMSEAY